jgi:hypothetical protein
MRPLAFTKKKKERKRRKLKLLSTPHTKKKKNGKALNSSAFQPLDIRIYRPFILLKSLEPYSFPKGTSREEVCSRLIKLTTQAYLGNVGLLTRPLTCGIF